MRLALLGADDETLALVAGGFDHADAQLIAAFAVAPEYEPIVRSLTPAARINEPDWEWLLLEGSVDLVVVGRGHPDNNTSDAVSVDDVRADQIRKLLAADIPLLLVHPACDLLLAYEVDLLRRDENRKVLVHHRAALHPEFAKLAELCEAGGSEFVGRIEYVTVERGLAKRDRGEVLRTVGEDVSLVRRLIGVVRKLSASGPITETMVDPLGPKRRSLPSLANLHVNFQGEAPFPARWSVGPGRDSQPPRITVVGTAGQTTFELNDRNEEWRIVWSRVADLLSEGTTPDDWADVCRDLEAASVVDRSVQRGRTVELLGEQRGEEESFKGVMAVGGCLTLMLVLTALLVAATVEGLQLPLRDWPAWQWWPVFVLVPVLVFLLLQTLQVLVKPSHNGERDGA